MTARTKRRLAAALAAGSALILTACSHTTIPQDSLNPAGPVARTEDHLFWPVFWIAVVVFVLVEGLLVVAMVRFRHRPGSGVPKQVHGNRRLEIGWTMAPALILAGIAVPTVATIFTLAAKPTGANVLKVNVTAHQFWWQADYPGLGVHTANEIHIPVGRKVFFSLQSIDVIHSFWIPRLAGKQDVVPNQKNYLTLQADQPGTYRAQCAEFCGLSHANMRFRVIAEPQAAFNAWLAAQRQPAAQPPPDVMGIMQLRGCGGCHTISGLQGFAGQIGPNLTHFASRRTFAGSIFPNNPGRVAIWLRDPGAVKPGVDMPNLNLKPAEIDALVAYLESLK
jgi:cytochrome c oxidase subunit 2